MTISEIFLNNIFSILDIGTKFYSYDEETSFLDKKTEFIKNIWNTEVNELSDIFNSNDDNYFIVEK